MTILSHILAAFALHLCPYLMLLNHVLGMQQSHNGVLRCSALLPHFVSVTKRPCLSSRACDGSRSATVTYSANCCCSGCAKASCKCICHHCLHPACFWCCWALKLPVLVQAHFLGQTQGLSPIDTYFMIDCINGGSVPPSAPSPPDLAHQEH